VKFGVFDHLDRAGGADLDVGKLYADRLRLIEHYERAGFYAYHLAEHHGTPLGLAPSPGLFLAAVAQRTTTLRFGPLVSVLGLQHPLRTLEEVRMLDQLSNGRLELGVGRGAVPFELGFFEVTVEDAAQTYQESIELLTNGGGTAVIDTQGRRFRLRDVPVPLPPVQRPHPPLWYGVARPDSARWAAEHGVNVVGGGSVSAIRPLTDLYRDVWARNHSGRPMPLVGMRRHVVVANTDTEARDAARPAYEMWHQNLTLLWRTHDVPIPLSVPPSFDDAITAGFCLVGSPGTVRDAALSQVEAAGTNYLLCQTAFGDLPYEVSERSVDLLAREVMPALPREAG
jgi:alkanesulfonate monooxygenase SsuD/methylene tetrahydromethanopterin reductase-like flavin-dependent oxidoreductase (luciferase family)